MSEAEKIEIEKQKKREGEGFRLFQGKNRRFIKKS